MREWLVSYTVKQSYKKKKKDKNLNCSDGVVKSAEKVSESKNKTKQKIG